jgi:hypothetical protein
LDQAAPNPQRRTPTTTRITIKTKTMTPSLCQALVARRQLLLLALGGAASAQASMVLPAWEAPPLTTTSCLVSAREAKVPAAAGMCLGWVLVVVVVVVVVVRSEAVLMLVAVVVRMAR